MKHSSSAVCTGIGSVRCGISSGLYELQVYLIGRKNEKHKLGDVLWLHLQALTAGRYVRDHFASLCFYNFGKFTQSAFRGCKILIVKAKIQISLFALNKRKQQRAKQFYE